jgi:nucleoside-diphosphate-sugar epimerase
MRILVTGGHGFIGHSVVKRLLDLDHQVRIIDNQTDYGIIPSDEHHGIIQERISSIETLAMNHRIDIESNSVRYVFQMFMPELVIHLASLPRQRLVNRNPQYGARVMTEGLINLLECSVSYGVTRFVYISSSMIYGDFTDNVKETVSCNPQGAYGIMKYTGEQLVKDYSRRGLLQHVIIRPSAVYGPLDIEDRVVSKFMLGAIRGETLQVNGPDERLDFTYVDDTVSGIVTASLSENAVNNTYNITRSKSVTLLEAAEMAISIAGRGTINIKERDLEFPSRGSLNIDRARQDLDYSPVVDFNEGLTRYYNWIRNNPFWIKKLSLS